jgi:hypothetical protein
MWPTALLSLGRKSCYGFLLPLKNLGGFEPANLRSNGKYDKNDTTENDQQLFRNNGLVFSQVFDE